MLKSAIKTQPSSNLKTLYQKFEQFWQIYPLPSYKNEAWKQFQQIDSDERLFAQIMYGLKAQLTKVKTAGAYWLYLANWLGQTVDLINHQFCCMLYFENS